MLRNTRDIKKEYASKDEKSHFFDLSPIEWTISFVLMTVKTRFLSLQETSHKPQATNYTANIIYLKSIWRW